MDLASFDLLNPQADMLDGLIGRPLLSSSDTPSGADNELPAFQAILQDEADVLLTQTEPRNKSLVAAVQMAMTEQSQQQTNLNPALSSRGMSVASKGRPASGLVQQMTESLPQPVAPPVKVQSDPLAEVLPRVAADSVDVSVSVDTSQTSDHAPLAEQLQPDVRRVGSDTDADLKAGSNLLAVAYNPSAEPRDATAAPAENTTANSSVASLSLLDAQKNAHPVARQSAAVVVAADSKDKADPAQSATARQAVLNPASISLTQTQLAQTQPIQTQPTPERLSQSLLNHDEPATTAPLVRGAAGVVPDSESVAADSATTKPGLSAVTHSVPAVPSLKTDAPVFAEQLQVPRSSTDAQFLNDGHVRVGRNLADNRTDSVNLMNTADTPIVAKQVSEKNMPRKTSSAVTTTQSVISAGEFEVLSRLAATDKASQAATSPLAAHTATSAHSNTASAPNPGVLGNLSTPVYGPLNMLQGDAAAQLNGHLKFMIDNGQQSALLKVHPAELGPIQFEITHSEDRVSISMIANSSATKELLDSSVTRLREMLIQQSGSGTQVDVNVSEQGKGNTNTAGFMQDSQRQYQSQTDSAGSTEGKAELVIESADTVAGADARVPQPRQAGAGYIDAYV